MKTLDKEIKKLETAVNQNQSGFIDAQAKLLLLRSQYNEVSANKVSASLLRLKQFYFDQGEKCGKLLAWRIKHQQTERAINCTDTQNGRNFVDPREILVRLLGSSMGNYKTLNALPVWISRYTS